MSFISFRKSRVREEKKLKLMCGIRLLYTIHFFEAVLIDNSVNKMIESRWQSKEFIFGYYEALFIGYYCLGEMKKSDFRFSV